MTFERVIRSLSGFVAAVIVFFLAGGAYLSSKGFVVQEDGSIVLMTPAAAQDVVEEKNVEIPDNIVLPQEHTEGKNEAPITLYEYSSFGCSHCADFHLSVLPKLKKKFVEKGWLKIVFVPFPLDAKSMNGALIAECIKADNYFPFIDVLYKKQRSWMLSDSSDKVIMQYASLYGLSMEEAEKCLHDDNKARELLSNRQNGITQLGIRGTPAFIIATGGRYEMVNNDHSYDAFKTLIEEKLNENKVSD